MECDIPIKIIRKNIKRIKKSAISKQTKPIKIIGSFAILALVIAIIFGNAFESNESEDKIVSVIGVIVIGIAVIWVSGFMHTIKYRCIGIRKCYTQTVVIDKKEFKPEHTDFYIKNYRGKPITYGNSYKIKLKNENFYRETFKWVYLKAETDNRYIAVMPNRRRSIIQIYTYDEINQLLEL